MNHFHGSYVTKSGVLPQKMKRRLHTYTRCITCTYFYKIYTNTKYITCTYFYKIYIKNTTYITSTYLYKIYTSTKYITCTYFYKIYIKNTTYITCTYCCLHNIIYLVFVQTNCANGVWLQGVFKMYYVHIFFWRGWHRAYSTRSRHSHCAGIVGPTTTTEAAWMGEGAASGGNSARDSSARATDSGEARPMPTVASVPAIRRTCLCRNMRIYVCRYMYVSICMYVCMYWIYVCIDMYVCVCV